MEVRFQIGVSSWSTDAIIIPFFEDEIFKEAYAELLNVLPWLEVAPALEDVKGKKGEVVVVYGPLSTTIPRVVIVGLGKRKKITPIKLLENLRNTIGKASSYCRELGLKNFSILVGSFERFDYNLERIIEEVICAIGLALYRFVDCKSQEDLKELPEDPQWIGVLFRDTVADETICNAARRGEVHATAVNLARTLDNTPANIMTPIQMSKKSIEIAKKYNMKCEVMDRASIISAGMGAFASVAEGSSQEPQFIILEYAPLGHENDDPLVFVGKGITFDTGGISIKPSAKMEEMKCDMSGAGAILGLFEALGQLKPQVKVIGLLACAENMPDGKATRPGDVVVTLSHKTVEIVNTDAEGRLVLCDAMTYAQKHWTPAVLIDIATLTGACVVALGDDIAGVFCDEIELVNKIRNIGELVGESYWSLPLDDRFFESLKSDFADFKNVGGREGGASTAAVFLKQFVKEDTKWAHLDIAGPSFTSKKKDLCPTGGTGFSVRTLIEFVMDYS